MALAPSAKMSHPFKQECSLKQRLFSGGVTTDSKVDLPRWLERDHTPDAKSPVRGKGARGHHLPPFILGLPMYLVEDHPPLSL